MARDEIREAQLRRSRYANEHEVAHGDEALAETAGGRESDSGESRQGSEADDEVRRRDVGAVLRSSVTGSHDPGTGANETAGGPDGTSEVARRAAEDIATGSGSEDRDEETPVFERGGMPKV